MSYNSSAFLFVSFFIFSKKIIYKTGPSLSETSTVAN